MSKRFIVLVLDGFGIGYMDDAAQVRPADIGADTLRHLCKSDPGLRLPTLEKLGLMNAAGFETDLMKINSDANFGRGALMHFGADTFWGHQEIMGTRPRKPVEEPFFKRIDSADEALKNAGYKVRRQPVGAHEILIVNDSVTVADNIECDPGQAVNVTAAIDVIPFDEVVKIGRIVRQTVHVSRVIVFGGRGVGIDSILGAAEDHGDYVGINAPGSGVYDRDYHCVHLGYGVDPETQAPFVLAERDVPTYLIGKVADVVANPDPSLSFPMVPTEKVMEKLAECAALNLPAFICANVQETDLSGHKESCEEYIEVLKKADDGLKKVLAAMGPDDLLVVMADHGNDPTIGHPHHTREYVPLLIFYCGARGRNVGVRASLADVGASACEFLGASRPESGESFLDRLERSELQRKAGTLVKSGLLSPDNARMIEQAVKELKNEAGIDADCKRGEAFVTHLCMALARKQNGEIIKTMDETLTAELDERDQSGSIAAVADKLVARLGLPGAERDYIRLHLHSFFD